MPHAFDNLRQQARSLAEAGDPEAARALLEDAVAQGRAGLAEGDPELLETMRQLAGLHIAAGDPAAARRVLEEAAAASRGDADPLVVMLAFDLAVVAEELANRHVARRNFAKVAELGPAALGEDHWAVTRAREYLDAAAQPSPPLDPGPPIFGAPTSAPPAAPVSASPTSAAPAPLFAPPPVSPAPPIAPPPVSPAPLFAPPPVSPAPSFEAVPPLTSAPPSPARRNWMPAALGGVVGGIIVAVVVAVLVLRPGDEKPEQTAVAQPAPSQPAAAAPVASAGISALPQAPVVPSAAASTTAPPSPPVTTAPATTAPTPAKTTPPPATVRTRIVAPAANSRVSYPFDARFSVAPADVKSTDTVVALLICVAGRCYLDGKLDIIGNGAAPYTIYLGSTRPEGTGVTWRLRLDRLPKTKYADLISQRDAAIADGSWGDKGTPLSALNATPVSTLAVVKG
ncbi:tetratricopeptide repeat protein [Paractinoplanes lichenicola]|uniref:Tetratricopeptide repeat protein n=1 Tax=Paractinoplanes lichenicola TaxID=2802976 RepID=A0ABS1VL13_9ACTN|nr:tetratricopeptide repeat protein [Actinoplanes lichenicola]MBL7255415.1 tetratricopeptide repeat protein [Actinoplanes lichenicola]